MGWSLGKKSPAQNSIKVSDFTKTAHGLRWHRALEDTVGKDRAEAVLDLILAKQSRTGSKQDKFNIGAQTRGAFTDAIDQYLQREVMQIQSRKAYVANLLGRAKSGKLRAELAGKTLAEADYAPSLVVRPGMDQTQVSLHKAFRWITKSWRGPGANVVMSALTHAAVFKPGLALGHDLSLLDEIYEMVVQGAPAVRGPNFMLNYPSSIGGRYLLEWILKHTPRVAWPARGDDMWKDYALFFLGSIVAVQGFTDGNKRMGRVAYSIVLIRAGVPFVAPTPKFENELFDMNMG